MSEYITTTPQIVAVTINPNPAKMNTAVVFEVSVSEVEVRLVPEERYSGTFYSGEV